ncbi:MAG: hypothetical protein WBL80_00375 [Erysipelotrichaceae bacterium]
MTDIGSSVGFLAEALFVGLVIVSISLFNIGKQLSKINKTLLTSKSSEEKI